VDDAVAAARWNEAVATRRSEEIDPCHGRRCFHDAGGQGGEMLPNQSFAPMIEITRGHRVESMHRGAIAVVDARGRLIASWGNPKEPVYVRSAAAPFQALALLCSGAADAFGLDDEELAVICSSHSGEARHVDLVRSVLKKAGLRTEDLHCGIHPPFDPGARRALVQSGAEPEVVHNNCSGKHAGMLAAAKHLGLSLEDYTDENHDIQIAIRGLLAFLSGLDAEEVEVAVDSCVAPTFYLPLRGFALAMARMAAAGEGIAWEQMRPHTADFEDDGLDGDADDDAYGREEDGAGELSGEEDEGFDEEEPDGGYGGETGGGDYGRADAEDGPAVARNAAAAEAGRTGRSGAANRSVAAGEPAEDEEEEFPVSIPEALARIWHAMKSHPILIAGSRRRLCTDLMRVAAPLGVPLVAKSGTEGVYAAALVQRGQAFGLALKVEDGSERARNSATLETLFQLGFLPAEARDPLAGYHRPVIRNLRDQPVGEVRARFRLNRGLPG